MNTEEYLKKLIEDFANNNNYSSEERDKLFKLLSEIIKIEEKELSEENIIKIINTI